MTNKKHIDRLFQEGFKDFEVTPNEKVWKAIETSLNQKKKKRRVIPIWWRYAGIAALLFLFLTIGFTYFNTSNNNIPQNQVVETESDPSDKTNNQEIFKSTKEASTTKPVITNNTIKEASKNSTNNTTNNNIQSKPSPLKNTTIVKTSIPKNTLNEQLNPPSNQTPFLDQKTKHEAEQNKAEKDVLITTLNNTDNQLPIIDKEKAIILFDSISKNKIAINNSKITEPTASKEEENTPTIEDALEKNNDLIEKEKEKQNRWSITPNAAPVYFNTLREGSSIDAQFNKNSKSGDINMSYGIAASYAVTNKLTVRSGINRVNLGYNTNDVIIFETIGFSNSSKLQNINSATGSEDSNASVSIISSESLNNSSSNDFSNSTSSINQALGYIEIPLELQYNLYDNKLKVNVIGGFSSLFLNNNKIYSETANGTRTLLGEASNINKTSYSANFGVGFNYHISNKIDLNLEPMFKYQINTFKNTSGNFTPFFIGVYTGFAIKF